MRRRDGDDPPTTTDLTAGGSVAGARDPSLAWPLDLREAVVVGDDVIGIRPQVCRGRWTRLPPEVAHGLARLRIDVRVVEAGLPRAELDDHDLEPTTEHLWVPDGEVPVACLRLLLPPGAPPTIDRACARADVRRLGLTSALVTDVLARFGADWVNALARPPLVPFFLKHGFELHPDAQDARDGDGCLVLIRHPEAPWRG